MKICLTRAHTTEPHRNKQSTKHPVVCPSGCRSSWKTAFDREVGAGRWRSRENYYMTQRIKSWVSELGENTETKRGQIRAWLQWIDFSMDGELPGQLRKA